jgi:hypothetical protein
MSLRFVEFHPSLIERTCPSASTLSMNMENEPSASLCDNALWKLFHKSVNEMIITKHGRCLFPVLKYKLTIPNDDEYYAIGIQMLPVAPYERLKYKHGKWVPQKCKDPEHGMSIASKPTALQHQQIDQHSRSQYEVLLHNYQVLKGHEWNRSLDAGCISFSRLKLTNQKIFNVNPNVSADTRLSSLEHNSENDQERLYSDFNDERRTVIATETPAVFEDPQTALLYPLQSFHKYIPMLHIYMIGMSFSDLSQVQVPYTLPHSITNHWTFSFPETEFVAVTHYQNSEINHLKKSFNPHAKGFKEDLLSHYPKKRRDPQDTAAKPNQEWNLKEQQVLNLLAEWSEHNNRRRSALLSRVPESG